jgi:hypothetical protein
MENEKRMGMPHPFIRSNPLTPKDLLGLRHRLQRPHRHHHRLHATVNHHAAALEVRLPRAVGGAQRETARVTELPVNACNCTLCHDL